MNKLTLNDIDVAGKRVLMRVDFNVPQEEDGAVRDDGRIRAALPSINYVVEQGGKLILMSHLGRPEKSEKQGDAAVADAASLNPTLKMDFVAERLRELVDANVTKVDAVAGPKAEKAVDALKAGEILLLENTRFHPGETKNDPELSKALANLGDVYVSDAFGAVHRAHASTVGAAEHFDQRAAGFLVAREIEVFEKVLRNPERPLAAILGGAKVSDKIGVLDHLLDLVDKLVIGGGMAYTFLKARGHEVGASILDVGGLDTAKKVMDKAGQKEIELLLPVDTVVANKFAEDADSKVVGLDEIEPGWQGLDIGPRTVALFRDAVADCKTVVWNGPLGVFEWKKFARGTRSMADLLGGMDAMTVIGGGDTAAAINEFGLADKMTHVSTGGGASLEMLEGKQLPGLAVLSDK